MRPFLLLLLAPPTLATEGLTWRFDDTHRYYIEADVRLGTAMVFRAATNQQVRMGEFRIRLVTTCRAEVATKRSWDLLCSVDDIALRGTPLTSERGRAQSVLEEYDQNLTGSLVQLTLTADGRVKDVDLEGISKSRRRLSVIHETLRQIMSRTFAGLDLQLPRRGDDDGRAWVQVGSPTTSFPVNGGTFGAIDIVHAVNATAGDLVEVHSVGKGVLIPTDSSTGEDGGGAWTTTVQGWARFDTALGQMAERHYLVVATPTAGNGAAVGGNVQYTQAVTLQRVTDGTAPTVGESGELIEDG
jgi:hypothetical protein